MHTIARRILETYIREKRILSIEELGLAGSEHETTKNLSFVTIYRDGKVIASSGRIHLKKPNTILELIENTLFCLRDPRFAGAVKNPDALRDVQIRVDLIRPDERRIITDVREIIPRSEGLILLSQTQNTVAVLLPNITNVASTPEEYFEIVCAKAGVNKDALKSEDYILYAISSTVYSDI